MVALRTAWSVLVLEGIFDIEKLTVVVKMLEVFKLDSKSTILSVRKTVDAEVITLLFT